MVYRIDKIDRFRGSSAGAIFFQKQSNTEITLQKQRSKNYELTYKMGQSLTRGLNLYPFEIFVPINPKSKNRIYENLERITGFPP